MRHRKGSDIISFMAGSNAQKSLTSTPQSENDWIVHAINIHGLFFEKWCQKVVEDSGKWTLKSSQYPVEFPAPNGPWRGKESVLDILAESRIGTALLAMPIECKKANPEFVNWVFFEKQNAPKDTSMYINQVNNLDKKPRELGWTSTPQIQSVHSKVKIPIAEEGRETRANYSEYKKTHDPSKVTKTANNAITEASNQVALATQSIFNEEMQYCQMLAGLNTQENKPYEFSLFLPTIVTTAQLFLCKYDVNGVSSATGEIKYDKAKLEQVPYLIYEYPLPRSLQNSPEAKQSVFHTNPEIFNRMHIAVVQSSSFDLYLNEIHGAFFS